MDEFEYGLQLTDKWIEQFKDAESPIEQHLQIVRIKYLLASIQSVSKTAGASKYDYIAKLDAQLSDALTSLAIPQKVE